MEPTSLFYGRAASSSTTSQPLNINCYGVVTFIVQHCLGLAPFCHTLLIFSNSIHLVKKTEILLSFQTLKEHMAGKLVS